MLCCKTTRMKRVTFVVTLITTGIVLFFSCKKWTDPAPVNDPRLTNPYCNDPDAVNYNWGFPGKPDNTICFYPSDIFNGNYLFTDSVYLTSSGLFIYAQQETLYVSKQNKTQLLISGLCSNGNSLHVTAHPDFIATIDTTLGDTTSINRGQMLCRPQDTVSGTFTYSRIDSLLHISFQVINDTGITTHIGKAKKI